MSGSRDDVLRDLTSLARAAGEPHRDLVIAGEGNASGLAGDEILVSASGSRLAEADDRTWVGVDPDSIRAAIDTSTTDESWRRAIEGARTPGAAGRPTVEVALHAVLIREAGARFVLHAHPTPVLSLLCSGRGGLLADHRYFPDHVVMLGRSDCLIPYVDPGLPLARVVRERVRDHARRHGSPPNVVLVENHGAFSLGGSWREALDRTSMLVKVARMILPTLPGGPVPMRPEDVERISDREDERYRRRSLA